MGVFFTTFSAYAALFAFIAAVVWEGILCPLWRHRFWLFGFFFVGAVLYFLVVGGVQLPAQRWLVRVLFLRIYKTFGADAGIVMGIPLYLMIAILHEAAKLLPAALYLHWHKTLPRLAVSIGGMVGAGFATFEGHWLLAGVFNAGWSWNVVRINGWTGLFPFFERAFMAALQIGAAGIASYGWATGKRWRYLALSVLLHFIAVFGVPLQQAGIFTAVQRQMYLIGWAVVTIAVAFLLRRSGSERAVREPSRGVLVSDPGR